GAEVARALRRGVRGVVEDERGGEGEGSIARRAAEYGPAARAPAAPRRGGGVGRGIDEGDEGARGRGEEDVGGERGPSQRLRPLHAGRAGAGVLDPHLEPVQRRAEGDRPHAKSEVERIAAPPHPAHERADRVADLLDRLLRGERDRPIALEGDLAGDALVPGEVERVADGEAFDRAPTVRPARLD